MRAFNPGGGLVMIDVEPELGSEEAQVEVLIDKLNALGAREFSVYLCGTFPEQRRAVRLFIAAVPPT